MLAVYVYMYVRGWCMSLWKQQCPCEYFGQKIPPEGPFLRMPSASFCDCLFLIGLEPNSLVRLDLLVSEHRNHLISPTFVLGYLTILKGLQDGIQVDMCKK